MHISFIHSFIHSGSVYEETRHEQVSIQSFQTTKPPIEQQQQPQPQYQQQQQQQQQPQQQQQQQLREPQQLYQKQQDNNNYKNQPTINNDNADDIKQIKNFYQWKFNHPG